MSIAGCTGWPNNDTFFIMSLLGWPIYDPNPLSSNPNPQKPVSGLCRVCKLGWTLTPLLKSQAIMTHSKGNTCILFFF